MQRGATLPGDGGGRMEFRLTVPRARAIAEYLGPVWTDLPFRVCDYHMTMY